MNTAQDIVARLNEQGMTDSLIAKFVGSTQPTIWRIRKGKISDCSASLYLRLKQLSKKKPRSC